MFRTLALSLLVTATLVVSCPAQDSRPSSRPTSRATTRQTPFPRKWVDEMATPIKVGKGGTWAEYGSPVQLKAQTSLKAVANAPEKFAGKTLLLRGNIQSICTKKGCWLRMRDNGEEIFVKFKDYAFFAPRHLAGYDVLLEGVVSFDLVKEAERRHMAEDAGKSREEIAAIVGDKKELRMMARAMRIIEPPQPRAAQIVTIGDHDNTKTMIPLEKVVENPDKFAGRMIDVGGQIVSVKAREFVVESQGRRLKVQFTNPLPDLKLVVQLKNAKRTTFFRGHGKLKMVDGKPVLAVKTAAVIH